jgi:hypothetical protein
MPTNSALNSVHKSTIKNMEMVRIFDVVCDKLKSSSQEGHKQINTYINKWHLILLTCSLNLSARVRSIQNDNVQGTHESCVYSIKDYTFSILLIPAS